MRSYPSGKIYRKHDNLMRNKPQLYTLFFILLQSVILLVKACQISEYYCDNRKCVSLDKFCNGVDDCGDGSDEPRHCSACNRTFYGEVGGTYSIAVHRPNTRESQLPYTCQLTFAAGGDKFGDLVEIVFNSATLGPSFDQDRYSEKLSPTCKEGHITLNEPDRPATAGHWCGHHWGQAVFFSETSRVHLTLSLFSVFNSPETFAFDFRLTYKFLRKSDATVRYGPPLNPFFRGQGLPGTFCSLIYNNCDKDRCAIQSPNYPGIYPRNITCYYAIRQLNAPVGHRPIIQLTQLKDHMVYVRNRAVSSKKSKAGDPHDPTISGSGKSGPGGEWDNELTFGDECDGSSDHVTIYDGYTIRDPILLKFCGGGKFPTITSSGNELLVEFYSAPTDYLLQNIGMTAIQGFHVDVEIKYLPLGSHTFVENGNCLFTVSSFQLKRGFLTSPQHSLPSHTTCTYMLQGTPGEIVWISLLKFYIGKAYGNNRRGEEGGGGYNAAGLTGSGSSAMAPIAMGQQQIIGTRGVFDCNSTYFQIWQGAYSERNPNNATLLAHLCEDTPIKRTCEFMLSSATSSKHSPRACHPDESFISKGPNMSLKLRVETTTVLRPAEFNLYYEFVDTRQDGEPFYHPHLLIGLQQLQENLPKLLREHQPRLGGGGRMIGGGINEIETDSKKFRVESCSRIFRSQNKAIQAGSFTSPRNVFYFGRGGVTNLTCVYRFQGGRDERVKVTFNKISLAGGYCKSEVEFHTGRSMCRPRLIERNETRRITEGTVQLWEAPWTGNDSRIMKECLCETSNGPYSFLSVSNTMDVVLQVQNMLTFHDQNHFTFDGRYEFVKHPDCNRAMQQKLKAPGGTFTLRQPEKVPYQGCSHYPWEIVPQSYSSHYIFLSVPGHTLKTFYPSTTSSASSSSSSSSTNTNPHHTRDGERKYCDSKNRILVYSGGFSGRLLQIICPDEDGSNYVHIFSTGWDRFDDYPDFVDNPHLSMASSPTNNQLIVELVSRGPGPTGAYEIKYMQISRRDEPLDWKYFSPTTSGGGSLSGSSGITTSGGNIIGIDGGHKLLTPGDISSGSSSSSIAASPASNEVEEDVCFNFSCPEINACISPTLFCDGVSHCPSGHDEAQCEYFPIPKTYLVLAAASLITFVVLSCCFSCLLCKKRRAERREKLLRSSRTPTEEFFGGGGGGSGHHHGHREIVC